MDEGKGKFYSSVCDVLNNIQRNNVVLLMGDLNGLCTMSRKPLSGYSISATVHEKMKKYQVTGKKRA